jgi:GNAT superfamily N-acetyltransferase
MPDIAISQLTGQQVSERRHELGDVYRRAFRTPPDEHLARFVNGALVRHATFPGYLCLIATDPVGEIIGFVYTYRSLPGHWWRDEVSTAITDHGFSYFLDDTYEFVEFAVVPEWQGRGIGSQLHDGVLALIPSRYALLSTDVEPNPAHQMYLHRGWIDLVPDYAYPGGGGLAILMGIDLDEWRRRTSYNGSNM